MAVDKLLLRAPNWIGDTIMMLPALRALRRCFPGTRIDVMALSRTAPLLENHPDLDRLIPFDPGWNLTQRHRFFREVRRERYPLGILFTGSFRSALFFRLAGVQRRVGYATDHRRLLLSAAVRRPDDYRSRHYQYYCLDLLANGLELEVCRGRLPVAPASPRIYLTKEELAAARRRLKKEQIGDENPLVGLVAAATYGPAKRWPAERFAETADRLARSHDAHVLLFGSRAELELLTELRSLVKESDRALNLAGKTSLRETAALMTCCDVVIANDTGTMHVAYAVGTPVVALFGSTQPLWTGPLGEGHVVLHHDVGCNPCFRKRCPKESMLCFDAITTDEVVAAAQAILQR